VLELVLAELLNVLVGGFLGHDWNIGGMDGRLIRLYSTDTQLYCQDYQNGIIIIMIFGKCMN